MEKMEKINKHQGYLYQWHTQDEFHALHMFLYLLKEEDQTVETLECTFRPYFYVEIPSSFLFPSSIALTTVQSPILRRLYSTFVERLISMMGYHLPRDCRRSNSIEEEEEQEQEECRYCWHGEISLENKKKLYFVQEREWSPFFKISFPSLEQRKKAYYKVEGKCMRVAQYNLKLKVHEYQAPPILQFVSTYSLSTVGWVEYVPTLPRKKTKELLKNRNYKIVEPTKLQMISERENVLFPKVCSFDIEVYSSNPKRMPQSDCEEDVIFQISMVFRDGVEKKGNTYLLSLGKMGERKTKLCKVLEYEGEKELLLGFHRLMVEENPEVLMGYNIMGFDIPYMVKRCEMHDIQLKAFQLGKSFPQRVCPVKEISWSSSAYAHQHFFFWEMDGRIVLDLLPMIRRDYKFASYSLKAVATFFLGDTKDPVTPKDIFESYQYYLQGKEESRKKLWTVGKYCVQDSILVYKLYEKLQVWIGLAEMAKICSVPIMSLFTQGQQIKVYSQVYRYCHQSKILVESAPSSLGKGDSYVGATVFPPDPGLYDDVIPFDFSSLYPTTIIAYNIDYSSCVPEERKDIPDEDCHVIEWEEHVLCEHDTTKYTTATKPTQTLCGMRRYRFLKSPSGVLPTVLQFLLGARKETKKSMKGLGEESLTYQVLDKRQLAYKVSANSMYGAMGVSKGYIPFLPGAMCTTARGRQSIQKASQFVQEKCQGKIVYGDSVAGHSCIWIRKVSSKEIKCMYMKDLICEKDAKDAWGEEWEWERGQDGKEYWTPMVEKEVWTEKGWTKIQRWMKHACGKKMYRVMTNQGWVEVTEDHSMILADGTPVKPQELKKNQHLLSSDTFSPFSAFSPEKKKNKMLLNIFGKKETHRPTTEWVKTGFQIGFVLQHYQEWMWKENYKIWESMLHYLMSSRSKKKERYEFVLGFLRCFEKPSFSSFQQRFLFQDFIYQHSMLIHLLMAMMEEFGGRSHWSMQDDKAWVWKVEVGEEEERVKRPCVVLVVEEIKYGKEKEEVYDFTTESHHFHAGVGKIVVHNTDSIYCHFPHVPFEQLWNHAKTVEKEFVALFPPPMKLVFEEKIYKQFLILTKKRYMALTCDETLNLDDGHLTIRGVLLARRDNCAWIRKVYEMVVRKILAHETFDNLMTFLCHCYYQLFSYQIPIVDFVVTKLVGKDYNIRALPEEEKKREKRLLELEIKVDKDDKNEKWMELYRHKNQPAHVQLAEKIRQRGGESMEAGVRIPYVICRHAKKNKAKLYEKVEDPLHVMQRSPFLQTDPFYYGRLMETPMDQLLGICFKNEKGRTKTCKYVVNQHEQFEKVMEDVRRRAYQPLLFPEDGKEKEVKPKKKKTIVKGIPSNISLTTTGSKSKQSSIYDFL